MKNRGEKPSVVFDDLDQQLEDEGEGIAVCLSRDRQAVSCCGEGSGNAAWTTITS